MFKISTNIKKVVVHIRTSVKLILLILLSLFIIVGIVTLFYKPIYRVTLKGEHIGYTENREMLQEKFNKYMNHGDSSIQNSAFAQIEELPRYSMCLLKKGIVTNDEEIYQKVLDISTLYYRYYAITDNGEEKYYTSTFEEAESAINELKEKNSTNKDKLAIAEKYSKDLKTFDTKDTIVSKLYVEPVKEIKVASTYKSTGTTSSLKGSNTSSKKVALGTTLIRPVSGTISSRYGRRSSGMHTGIDIAAPNGTTIKAAASGTVTFSGGNPNRSYGYYIIISHGNGVQTYYCHCSKLLVSAGTKVSQGQPIAKVGKTGNATGNHLHFEIRVNGVTQNPQNYVY